MDNLRSEIIDTCLEKRRQGMEYSQIRAELQNSGIKAEEIKDIIRIVDRYDRREAVNKAKVTSGVEYVWVGRILVALGMGIFAFTLMVDFKVWVLPIGAIVTGSYLLAIGRGKMRK